MKELDKNLALRVRKTENEDGKWIVSGRGVLHLSVLIETMRREGYELQVGQPQVIFKEIDGVKCEPIEELTISVPEEFASKMIDMVTRRKGEMVSMETQGDRVNIDSLTGRSHHGSPLQGIPALQRRYPPSYQRLHDCHGKRNSFCIRHR